MAIITKIVTTKNQNTTPNVEHCYSILGEVSKILGIILFSLVAFVSVLALFVLYSEEYYHIAIIEITHILSLVLFSVIYPFLKL